MSAPTNTLTAETPQVGAREDLSDVIYRVAPEETPFVSNIKRTKATAIVHEWQTETLAAPDPDNAQLEGDDVGTLEAPNVPTRVKNICQIFEKDGGVSRTQQVVNLAGRADELDRQKVIKALELRRDMEARFCANKASVEESGATPRSAAGALAWITSNDSRGSGGTDGGYSNGLVSAAGNGALRSFTEALVKAVRATSFGNGGKATQAYMAMTLKQKFSAFTGVADIRKEVRGTEQAVIIAAADVYVDDVGELVLIPHPYAFTRECFLADPKMWAVSTLDGIKTEALAKTGDSDKFMITAEATLEAKNEKSSGVIADIE
jgi:citrate lyase gamma subunit